MDKSLADDQQRMYAARISFIVGIGIMLCKFFAYRVTSSEAVLSDALESIVNVVSAAMVILTIRLTQKPADKDHPYGHGKVEFFSAAFEGGLVACAALFICIEAITSLLYGHQLSRLTEGLLIIAIAGIANLLLGLYLLKRGERLKSLALESSGKHVISDFWTSAGIIGGLLIVKLTGWIWLDSLLALCVGLYLAWVGFKIVKKSVDGLMDGEDQDVLQEIASVLQPHMTQGIIDVHEMKLIRSGRNHHIDLHLVLPEFWSIKQAHERVEQFEEAVFKDYPYEGEMHFHYDACQQNYCAQCDLKECHLRKEPLNPKVKRGEIIPIRQSQSDESIPLTR